MSNVNILQIGEGNFIRAFFDFYIDLANERLGYNGSIAMCQPRINNKVINALKAHNCEFDVICRGTLNGKPIDDRRKITCVSDCIDTTNNWDDVIETACLDSLEFIVSNTTEAGIYYDSNAKYDDAPDCSYPAKLTRLLYERYKRGKSGVIVLPLELIENNADTLRIYILNHAVKWSLDDGFFDYIYKECSFCNTLVDRIVTGHIEGDSDPCSVACEPFFTLVIQADEKCKERFPVIEDIDGVKVFYTNDIKPYIDSKLKILNGLHTMSVLGAYIHGFDNVYDMINDEEFRALVENCLSEEILPTVLVSNENKSRFADFVIERFSNPFIEHRILDISLNSVAKYQARCMTTVFDYYRMYHKAPRYMSLAFAYLIRFYKGEFKNGKFIGRRVKHGIYNEYEIRDSQHVLEAFEAAYKTDDPVKAIMSDSSLWEIDMSRLDGFYDAVKKEFDAIDR